MPAPKTYNLPHLDAGENVFFARELEHILAEQFDVKYAELKGRRFCPVDNSVPAEDESVTYESFDSAGQAKKVVDYSEDLPMVNVKGTQSNQRLQEYGAAFGYSIDEIRKAAKVKRPLERMRAMAARKVLDQKLDGIAASGDSTAGLKGLLNLSSTNTYTIPDSVGTPGTKTWAVKTPDEILADMTGACKKVVVDSKEIERPTKILLPTDQYELINSTPRSSVSDTTILAFFLGTHPGMTVESWERLAGAGDTATDRMVAYDPVLLNLRLLMAKEFEQMPPQQVNMSFKINCLMKTGGVITAYPKSVLFADGI